MKRIIILLLAIVFAFGIATAGKVKPHRKYGESLLRNLLNLRAVDTTGTAASYSFVTWLMELPTEPTIDIANRTVCPEAYWLWVSEELNKAVLFRGCDNGWVVYTAARTEITAVPCGP